MDDPLRPYLEKLLVTIQKDQERFKQKSDDALFLRPYEEWSAAELRRYLDGTTEQRLAESDKWLNRHLDAHAAEADLRYILFSRKLKYG